MKRRHPPLLDVEPLVIRVGTRSPQTQGVSTSDATHSDGKDLSPRSAALQAEGGALDGNDDVRGRAKRQDWKQV